MKEDTIDIIELLEAERTIQIKPQGYSMYPMLVPDRDSVIIRKADQNNLKRGDVVLYRRNEGILVLHRIGRIREEGVYLVGDNQVAMEGPLGKDQIKGVMVAFIYKGKTISAKNSIYWISSRGWLMLRPYRKIITKTIARFFNNNKEKKS